MPIDPLTGALVGAGTAASIFGDIAGGKGGEDRPAVQIPGQAIQALETGLGAAEQQLETLGAGPTGQSLQEQFQQIQNRISALESPAPTLSPEQMTQAIAESTVAAQAPIRAEQARQFREEAGAYGPSAALNRTRAAQQAEEQLQTAQMIAQLRPQFEAQDFNQRMAQLQGALGIIGAQQQAYLQPFQAIHGQRAGTIGQLLGIGGSAAQAQPLQMYEPAYASTVGRIGSELMQVPTTLDLLNRTGGQPKRTGPTGIYNPETGRYVPV